MKENIGITAGRIWERLRTDGELNLSQLPKILNENSALVYQALGWLAREDKIEYRTMGSKILVSLSESERT